MQFSTTITRQFNLLDCELVAVYIVYYHMIHSQCCHFFFIHLSIEKCKIRVLRVRCTSKHNEASQVHNEQIALELSEFHFILLQKAVLTPVQCACACKYFTWDDGTTIKFTPGRVTVFRYILWTLFILCLFVYKLNKTAFFIETFHAVHQRDRLILITNFHFIQFLVIIWCLLWRVAIFLNAYTSLVYSENNIEMERMWYTTMSGIHGSSLTTLANYNFIFELSFQQLECHPKTESTITHFDTSQVIININVLCKFHLMK